MTTFADGCSRMTAFANDRLRWLAIDGSVSILVDWFEWHSSGAMEDWMPIGLRVHLRSLWERNDEIGSISRRPTRIGAQHAS
jgi:hypothetical protein